MLLHPMPSVFGRGQRGACTRAALACTVFPAGQWGDPVEGPENEKRGRIVDALPCGLHDKTRLVLSRTRNNPNRHNDSGLSEIERLAAEYPRKGHSGSGRRPMLNMVEDMTGGAGFGRQSR